MAEAKRNPPTRRPLAVEARTNADLRKRIADAANVCRLAAMDANTSKFDGRASALHRAATLLLEILDEAMRDSTT